MEIRCQLSIGLLHHRRGQRHILRSRSHKKRKMGNAESFTYNYLKVNFTVYENGYFTYWATHQKYSLAYAVIKGYLVIDIAAEMDSRSYLSYDSNECKVDNFIDN